MDTSTGRMLALVNQLNHRSTLVWDSIVTANRDAVVNALNQRTTYAYNSRGQITAIENRTGQRTTYVFDSIGRQLAIVDPL